MHLKEAEVSHLQKEVITGLPAFAIRYKSYLTTGQSVFLPLCEVTDQKLFPSFITEWHTPILCSTSPSFDITFIWYEPSPKSCTNGD